MRAEIASRRIGERRPSVVLNGCCDKPLLVMICAPGVERQPERSGADAKWRRRREPARTAQMITPPTGKPGVCAGKQGGHSLPRGAAASKPCPSNRLGDETYRLRKKGIQILNSAEHLIKGDNMNAQYPLSKSLERFLAGVIDKLSVAGPSDYQTPRFRK